MANTKITVEHLGERINEGFKTMTSKEEIKAVNTRIDGIDSR